MVCACVCVCVCGVFTLVASELYVDTGLFLTEMLENVRVSKFLCL